jgi:hypothetical protein
MFLRIKKAIMGMITVKMNMGRIFPVCSSTGLYFGVTVK